MSDTTGKTAGTAFRATAEQFRGIDVHERLFPHVRDANQIRRVMREAQQVNALVVHTLVDPTLRDISNNLAVEHHVTAIDLMGMLLGPVGAWLGEVPLNKPGHLRDERYYRQLQAHGYAHRQQDGKNPSGLREADVVVLGVSRAGKSSVCRDLAEHGLKAADIPLVLETTLPSELKQVDRRRIFVLHNTARNIVELRNLRIASLGGADVSVNYIDLPAVQKEVMYALHLLKANPEWTGISMALGGVGGAVAEILSQYQQRFLTI